jgi:hypothetical protein
LCSSLGLIPEALKDITVQNWFICFRRSFYSFAISQGLEMARELEICVLRNKNVSLSRCLVLDGVSFGGDMLEGSSWGFPY